MLHNRGGGQGVVSARGKQSRPGRGGFPGPLKRGALHYFDLLSTVRELISSISSISSRTGCSAAFLVLGNIAAGHCRRGSSFFSFTVGRARMLFDEKLDRQIVGASNENVA